MENYENLLIYQAYKLWLNATYTSTQELIEKMTCSYYYDKNNNAKYVNIFKNILPAIEYYSSFGKIDKSLEKIVDSENSIIQTIFARNLLHSIEFAKHNNLEKCDYKFDYKQLSVYVSKLIKQQIPDDKKVQLLFKFMVFEQHNFGTLHIKDISKILDSNFKVNDNIIKHMKYIYNKLV